MKATEPGHRRPNARSLCLATVVAWTLLGCADQGQLEAITVLEHDQCAGLKTGLSLTGYPDLARIRGASLLSMSRPDADVGADEAAGSGAAAQPILIALSRGPQPTPGYALSLESATLENQTAVLRLRWETPPPDAALAQVITHPCLVIALPGAGFDRVRAIDQLDTPLGSLELSPR